MSLLRKGTSALGKLFAIAVLAAAFFAGLVGVVYMSLQGEELKVPEIVGKDFVESEKELAQMGLKIKRRADRYSKEKQNTILEQRPKAGEIVKTGQMILVVVSKEDPDGDEAPATIETDEEDDIEKIEELISDKPKPKSKRTSNTEKKKNLKTRDVKVEKKKTEDKDDSADANADVADKTDDSKTADKPASDGDNTKAETKKETLPNTGSDKKPADKPIPPKPKQEKPKPKVEKPKNSGETRPRVTP